MRKQYKLQGLDCANCANKIEKAINEIDYINDASINFMNLKLTYTVDKGNEKKSKTEIQDLINKVENGVKIVENEEEHNENNNRLIRIGIGSVIYILSVAVTFPNEYINLVLSIISYLIIGYDVVFKAFRNIAKGNMLDENFLMTIATLGAYTIGEYPEAVAVMLFYQVGEFFQDYAVNKSRKSISSLMDLRPDFANLVKGDSVVQVNPETVEVGSVLVVKVGEKVPIDGVVLEGESFIDTRAITGEPVPRSVNVGDELLSGCVNLNTVLRIQTTKEFSESTVSKILELVENATSKKSNSEKFITRFARYYTPIVVVLAALIAIVPPIFVGDLSSWVYRALTFLVISCPCALVISVPLGFFGGVGSAARQGVLVKGSNYLEMLAKLDRVVFDKTGTLTKGVFKVQKIIAESCTVAELLEVVAYAEHYSNHPIAKSIIAEYNNNIDEGKIGEVTEISGKGLKALINEDVIYVGNKKLMDDIQVSFNETEEAGTVLYVAKNDIYLGYILIADEVKTDSEKAIAELKKLGISETAMLTGDSKKVAKSIGEKLRVDTVFAELLPDEKVTKFEEVLGRSKGKGKVAFVGDGINDAPVLARADIGISMGKAGSELAIETSDIVIMTDELSKLPQAIRISKKTLEVVKQNIVFSISVKVIVLILSVFGLFTMWWAVFADVGVSVIAILNAMRLLRYTGK